LGGYRLLERLGGGAFADVYRGEPLDPNEPPAAIKVLRVRPENSDLVRFCQEATTIKKLKHENIVKIYHFGVENDIPYLAVEFAPHGTLELPKDTRLSPEKAAEYLDQIADALDYIHRQGLMHRDIKPANLLLGEKPNGEKVVLVSDFGLAQAIQNTSSQKTEVAGTFAYAAPEQIAGKARKESDQYGVAAVLYQWLSGSFPFDNLLEKITPDSRPKPLIGKIPGISQEMQDVLFKGLAREPKDRYPDVRTFAKAFKRACGLKSGRQHLRSGRYQAALAEFNRLYGLDENDTFALFSRGQTYQAMGKKKEALNDYRKAINLGIQDRELLRSVMAALNELR
jgi:serine/threonine protein kinase